MYARVKSKYKEIKNKILKSEFNKHTTQLLSGTVVSQMLPVAFSPILSRVYTPEDFGVWAIFISLTAILASIVNARYEGAIVLAKTYKRTQQLNVLCFYIAIVFSLLTAAIVLLFHTQASQLLNSDKIDKWLFLLPVAALSAGLFNVGNGFSTKHKKFKTISQALIIKAGVTVGFQLLAGYFFLKGPGGLIVGHVLGLLLGNNAILKGALSIEIIKQHSNKKSLVLVAAKYKNFPLYTLPSTFINTLSLNINDFLISKNFGLSAVGQYSVSKKLIGLPSSMIGGAIGQVYLPAAVEQKNKLGNTTAMFNSTLKKLIMVAFPIFAILFFVVQPLTVLVFGPQWVDAGLYSKILIPLFLIRLISSGLSNTCIVYEKQYISTIINIILFVSIVIVFLVAQYLKWSFVQTLYLYSAVLSLEYLSFIFVYWRLSQTRASTTRQLE